MSLESNRFHGILKIQGRTFHYVLLKEKDKTFVQIADIIFERNRKNNLLKDINLTLEKNGLIAAPPEMKDDV